MPLWAALPRHERLVYRMVTCKDVILQYKIVSKMGRVRSPKRRVRDDDFIVGLCSDFPRIVFLLAEALQGVAAEIERPDFVAGAVFGEVGG